MTVKLNLCEKDAVAEMLTCHVHYYVIVMSCVNSDDVLEYIFWNSMTFVRVKKVLDFLYDNQDTFRHAKCFVWDWRDFDFFSINYLWMLTKWVLM